MHFSLTDLAADIAQNGAESGASLVELEIRESSEPPSAATLEFRFIIRDNGKGMGGAVLDRAMVPFVTDGVKHPGRKVGLGIPFLIQTAVQSGGGWSICSTVAGGETAVRFGGGIEQPATGTSVHGTVVEAWFDLANVDTPPVGDIPGLFRTALLFAGPKEVVIKRSKKGSEGKADLDYRIVKTELIEALGGELESVSSLVLLRQYLQSLEGDSE